MIKLNTITSFLFISLFAITSNAQSVDITDGFIKFDKEPRPCLIVHVDPEPKRLKTAWKKYLKNNYELRLSGNQILSAERVTIAEISENAMDFYTQINEDENGSEMRVFARHGYDIYINRATSLQEYNKIRSILENFLKTHVSNYYQEIIDDTEKAIKKHTKEEKKLESKIAKNSKKAEKLKVKSEELIKDVVQYKDELAEAKEKITMRNEKLKIYKTKLSKVK